MERRLNEAFSPEDHHQRTSKKPSDLFLNGIIDENREYEVESVINLLLQNIAIHTANLIKSALGHVHCFHEPEKHLRQDQCFVVEPVRLVDVGESQQENGPRLSETGSLPFDNFVRTQYELEELKLLIADESFRLPLRNPQAA